ncbi:SAM-dependent methyltransferase [Asanoa ferruginea]|nr:methyltransferase domain-containing protein [Asanoa ferruginea]GIF46217.1 SAM-dependent methyltransferase [Asanoa ferruginea]
MSDPPPLGTGVRLDFNGPLSAARADRLALSLAGRGPATVLDLGCGWGELLLRVLTAAADATGVGVDSHAPDLVRARANAAARGLSDRVTFIDGPAADHATGADLILNIGAYQAFGDISAALSVLRGLVNPGGRLLFAAEFWEQPPPPERLARMWPGITAADCDDLPGLVDRVVAAGFRPLRIETVTRGEWEEFESGLAADAEEWLLANPDHEAAAELRSKLDNQRAIWLRGHRDLMGFAYLTLG